MSQDTRLRHFHDRRQARGKTAAFIGYPRPYARAAPGIHVDKLKPLLLPLAKPARIRVILLAEYPSALAGVDCMDSLAWPDMAVDTHAERWVSAGIVRRR